MAHYLFKEQEKSCYLVNQRPKPLTLISSNSFQWIFKHNEADLIIEKLAPNIITATLRNVNRKLGTIKEWDNKDYGCAVYDQEKGDYVIEYGHSKIFHIFINNYNKDEPWEFCFNYHNHLILKDKDEKKPHYWYYFDYTSDLANFVYKTLNPHIKPRDGQIVALPAELGDGVKIWDENNYMVNFFYCGFDEENANYDFYLETYEKWIKKTLIKPALIITFLPTYFKNYELKKGQKVTGTTWFKKIWEVFGSQGVPIVLKCYPGFIFVNLYRLYPKFYEQINSITQLPTEINNRQVGSSNLLVFFNCPWLDKKTPYIIK